MCNRGRKLLLFNDFLVAPTTIVVYVIVCAQRAIGQRLLYLGLSAPWIPIFLPFFSLSRGLSGSWIGIQLPAVRIVLLRSLFERESERERGYAARLSSRSRYRRIVWLIDVVAVQQSNYLHIARNKTGWSSLNIHEDRSSYRRLSTSDYDITMLIFKNCFSTLNALLLIIFFFRVYVIEFWL